MNARVRRPGCERGGDGLGGAAAHVAVGGHEPRERGVERDRLRLAGRASTVSAETCSLNRRPHAEAPEIDFSVRIFSSGSVSRCGR